MAITMKQQALDIPARATTWFITKTRHAALAKFAIGHIPNTEASNHRKFTERLEKGQRVTSNMLLLWKAGPGGAPRFSFVH